MDREIGLHPEKLFANVKQYATLELAQHIAYGKPLPEDATDAQCAEWVAHVAQELEANFDAPTIKQIRQGCYCREEGKLDENKQWLAGIYKQSGSVTEFVDKVNAHGAGWYMAEGALYTKYFDCSCPLLQGVERLQDGVPL